ncbi:MAG: cytochrome C [Caldimicrobium sp.]
MKNLLCSALVAGTILLSGAKSIWSDEVVTYEKNIKPIVEKYCIACHGNNAPPYGEFKKEKNKWIQLGLGPKMDTYEDLMTFVNGDDAGALMRRLDDGTNKPDGKPGNMYIFLGKTEDERKENLKIFKKWVGHWSLKRKKEWTEEDYKAIKAIK